MVLHLLPSALADFRLPIPRLPSSLGAAPPPLFSIVDSIPVIGPSVNRKVLRCCEKVGSLRRSHSSAIAACSFSSSRLCSRTARRSALPVALARWLYQSTASSSSINETMARCWSMTSGPSLPASSCSDSLDMGSPSEVHTSATGRIGKRRAAAGVPRLETSTRQAAEAHTHGNEQAASEDGDAHRHRRKRNDGIARERQGKRRAADDQQEAQGGQHERQTDEADAEA